jgi:outer membrane protein OmpA-like peptidoglycan-associated protein
MKSLIREPQKSLMGKSTSTLLVFTLAITGFVSSAPAHANTAESPTIVFNGNTLATSTPKDEIATRLEPDSLALSPVALTRVATTTREGYTFGGWSLEKGGAVTQEITTPITSTFRIIYAVWNTKITYNLNKADSGALTNFKTQDVYRFGQNLPLPTVGSLVKSGYSFGGWMTSASSPTRITDYIAGSADVGNPTLYAAWIRNVSFDANGGSGTAPESAVYTSGGPRLKLPSFTEVTLKKPGFTFAGWSNSPVGSLVTNPGSYLPPVAQTTLYAVWKSQSTAATPVVSFKAGKSVLSSSQKLILDDLASSIGKGSAVTVAIASVRAPGSAKALGRARIAAVVNYLKASGITATYTTTNSVSKSGTASTPSNNRVTVQAGWTNPAN